MGSNVGLITGIARAFTEGGIWMYAILAAHIVALSIIGERTYVLFFQRQKNQKNVARQFEEDIKMGRIEKAITRAKATEQPIAAVIQAGAQAAHGLGGREEIQAKMDEVLAVENAKLERRTGFLSMLGNVGTLLGLLGTIVGLIESFASINNLSASARAEMLTRGVALAMNATAYGLIMAIPTLVMYAVLMNRTHHLQEDLNQAAFKAFNWLSFNYEPTATKKSKSV